MKFTARLIPLFLILFFSRCTSGSKTEILSPDGRIRLSVINSASGKSPSVVSFSVSRDDRIILLPSSLEIKSPDLNLDDLHVTGIRKSNHTGSWNDKFGARSEVPDNYNEAEISLKGERLSASIICRVYNEGAAFSYEFSSAKGIDSLVITDEKLRLRFPSDYPSWSAPRAQAQYRRVPLTQIDKGCERPLVVEYDSTLTVALAEAGLVDFARMKFEPDSSAGIGIRSRLDGPVKRKVPFRSPWRVVMIGNGPGDLLEKNYLLMNLNDPSEIKDDSWIKPGKAVREVTLTTTGARQLIDFISEHNLQYIEFDAGWYGYEYDDASDARAVNVDPKRSKGPLDLKEVIGYAKSKDVGVLLYVNRRALEKQLDELLPLYRSWGISGLKFGFVQVGTQPVTAWMHEAVKKAAEYNMIVDIHDEYRPTGFSRTYPNLLTQEGIRGDEESPPNSHTLITMFTRCLAGAADNTICYYDRRVEEKMGSHASQLAKAVCILSSLQFLYWYDRTVPEGRESDLSGKPNYLGDEPELEFFDRIPTTWDETRVLHARIGEYGVIARRKGKEWFIGGINNDLPRTLSIGFSFLSPDINYSASVYSDDPSVDTRTHVKIDRLKVDNKTLFPVVMDSNKGFAIHIKPE